MRSTAEINSVIEPIMHVTMQSRSKSGQYGQLEAMEAGSPGEIPSKFCRIALLHLCSIPSFPVLSYLFSPCSSVLHCLLCSSSVLHHLLCPCSTDMISPTCSTYVLLSSPQPFLPALLLGSPEPTYLFFSTIGV